MSREECHRIVESYVDWLKQGLGTETIGSACELTTPFLDRHNDHLQIYAKRHDGKISLTDDGYTLADLRTSGMELNTPKRKSVVDTVLRGLGVKQERGALVVEATQQNLGQKVHSLIQAMLAVNDMFVLAQPRVAAFFLEDVRDFLSKNDVRYSPRVKVAGKSGFDHAIDFLIPRSATRPERLVQAINAPNKNTIGTYLFALSDTREARDDGAEAYAFLNDEGRAVGGDVVEALQAYDVKPALWSDRNAVVELLKN